MSPNSFIKKEVDATEGRDLATSLHSHPVVVCVFSFLFFFFLQRRRYDYMFTSKACLGVCRDHWDIGDATAERVENTRQRRVSLWSGKAIDRWTKEALGTSSRLFSSKEF